MPSDLSELLRSLHVHSLRNDEVLLLKDSRRLMDRKDSVAQVNERRGVGKCFKLGKKEREEKRVGSEL